MPYVKWLEELGGADVRVAGGKGANLGEMTAAEQRIALDSARAQPRAARPDQWLRPPAGQPESFEGVQDRAVEPRGDGRYRPPPDGPHAPTRSAGPAYVPVPHW